MDDSAVTTAASETTAWLVLSQGNRPATTIPLVSELSIGRDVGAPPADGHLTIAGDPSVSRLHAILTRRAVGWCVQAPQVTNGLFVNGVRLADGAFLALENGDEIRVGEQTALVFRSLETTVPDRSHTRAARAAPDLTSAERRVMLALCLPLLDGDGFTPPASVAAIANQLFVTDSAVKQHLGRLYLKFDVPDGTDRRVRLANDALTRGVIRRADLEAFRSAV